MDILKVYCTGKYNSKTGFLGPLLPWVVADEKNVVFSVDEYKLPAWSYRVLQLAFKAKQMLELTTQLIVAAEFSDIERPSRGPWFVNLSKQ
jgi:hypothetical protein